MASLAGPLAAPRANAMDNSGHDDYKTNPDDRNEAPYNPPAPWGPSPVGVGNLREYCTQTTDPDGDPIQYVFDWDDGSTYVATAFYPNGEVGCDFHQWSQPGTYCIRAYAQDTISPVRPDWRDGACYEVLVREQSANQAPGIPAPPSGPSFRSVGQSGVYCAKTTDPDGDPIQYVFLWDDGSQTMVPTTGTEEGCASHSWSVARGYCVKVYAQDVITPVRGASACKTVNVGSGSSSNSPPAVPPRPSGPAGLQVRQAGTFCALTTDPDGDRIQYVFNWGDNTPDSVTESMPSGQQGCASHSWAFEDTYCVKVYAQDLVSPVPDRSPCKDVSVVAGGSGNTAPYVPAPPGGPSRLDRNEPGTFCTSSSDPDDDYFQYVFFWGDDTHTMSETGCASHAWSTNGSYCIQAYTQDLKNEVRGWSKPCTYVEIGSGRTNRGPTVPAPPYTSDGVYSHPTGTAVTYCAQSTDPDGDAIEYVFYWDNGNDVTSKSVSNRVASGQVGCATHAWPAEGSYCVEVYAQDGTSPIEGTSGCRTETATSSAPAGGDTDGDGLTDAAEAAGWTIGVDHQTRQVTSHTNNVDSDGDGLSDGQEYIARLDPKMKDTDADGIEDPLDDARCDAARSDTDGDGLGDGDEQVRGTSCLAADTDGDSLTDGREVAGWSVARDMDGDGDMDGSVRAAPNPLVADTDNDNLLDSQEWLARTDPADSDTDDDGRADYAELASAETLPERYDPPETPASLSLPVPWQLPGESTTASAEEDPKCGIFSQDVDCDKLSASHEQMRGTDPNKWDTDGDGASDGAEVWMWATDPLDKDTDADGMLDPVDVRPLEEDKHPFVSRISSEDYYSGVTIVVADQSRVTFLLDEMRFYHPTAGFECDEDFQRGFWSVELYQVDLSSWGAPLYSTEFHIGFIREEHAYYASDSNVCGPDFIATLPFRDAFGNTVQVEVTGHANSACHVDPMRIVDLGLGLAAGPLANSRTTTGAKVVAVTTIFGIKALTRDPAGPALGFMYGIQQAHTKYKPYDFVGPRQPASATSNVLRWVGPVYAGIGIATGDYMKCDLSTTTGNVHVVLENEDTAITDVQGRTILMDVGVAEGRAHPKATEIGDAWKGLGDARAGEDGSGYRAWFAETLQHPVHHYSVEGRYHVYCPADEAGGYVITSEPKPGMSRAMFITAYAAMAPAGSSPHMVRQCPPPAKLLP